MRPIKLTMTAFGPYAGREVVDFRDAVASGLFGIYGSTGSGKSSIFNAMTFALFGEASHSEQDTASLRSDHAVDNVLTEVEFIFELGSSRYLIRRTPDQLRPALRGNGETKDVHKAWLFDVTGIDLDEITEANPGKIIAEKKVSQVKEAVLERLGYGAEQFRQIVLLPQGKFETFLTAKTDERMKILRDLFDVSLYRKLTQTLKEQAKEAEDAVMIDRRACARRLEQEGYESPDALKVGIAAARNGQAEAEKILAVTAEASVLASKALVDANQVDAEFVAQERAQLALQALLSKAAEMGAADTKLKNARKAESLLDIYSALEVAQTAVTKAEDLLTAAESANKKAASAKDEAAKQLSAQNALSVEREDQRRRVEELARHTTTLTQAGSLMTDWQNAQSNEAEAKTVSDQAEATYGQIARQQLEAQAQAKREQSKSLQRSKISAELTKAKQVLEETAAHAEAKRLWSEATDQATQAVANHVDTQTHLENAQKRFDAAEKALAEAQAQHLAEKLEAGQPCSVCGSKSHPAPATGSAESAGLDEAFRDARTQLEAKRTENAKAAEMSSAAKARAEDRKSNLEKIPDPQSTYETSQQKIDELKDRLSVLGPEVDIAYIEASVVRLTEQATDANSGVAKARAVLDESKIATALAKQAYDSALGSIPEALRSESALLTASQSADLDLKTMLAALETAQENAERTREVDISCSKDLESAEKLLNGAKTQCRAAEETFADRLRQHSLSLEQFETHKTDIAQIEILSADIAAHKEALAIAKDRLKTATETIQKKQRPDLEALEQTNLAAETAKNADAEKVARLNAKTQQLESLLTSIAAELARIEKVEQDTVALRELAALFNANNVAKLDLETFAIGAMFDQVLQAANLRIQPMTSGRYSLERELDGKGGGRRGLGISVHDTHTGKTRATATLSGGETFIAALALALGLSDIVESVSGNIRLDTIFIDEGFGSLDTENDTGTLDQVLQTLQNLAGRNRAVGLISHVPLVQQAIPNGFSITKTAVGSHVETRGF